MSPIGMLLQNLTVQTSRNLLTVTPNIFTAILYRFVLVTTLSFTSNSSFPSSVFIHWCHISSQPSICFIKCEEGGGKVCKKQGDCMFVQCLAQLPSHGSGLHRLTLFQQWIIMTLQSMLPALFWMDTLIHSIFIEWQSFSTRILAIDYFCQWYFQRNEERKCTVYFSLRWSFWCSICNGNEHITYSCVQIRKMTNINNPCSIHL